jgi:hypothetical protein
VKDNLRERVLGADAFCISVGDLMGGAKGGGAMVEEVGAAGATVAVFVMIELILIGIGFGATLCLFAAGFACGAAASGCGCRLPPEVGSFRL